MWKPKVLWDPWPRLFWMLWSTTTTKNCRFCHHYSTKWGWCHLICRIIPEDIVNKNVTCLFALAASAFKRCWSSGCLWNRSIVLVVCKTYGYSLQLLGTHFFSQPLPHSVCKLDTKFCVSWSLVKTNRAESLPSAQGLRHYSGAVSRHGGSPALAEGMDPPKIFTHSQFSARESCSDFIFPWRLLYRPNAGRFAQGEITEVFLTQRSCSTEVYILAPKYKNTESYQRKYLRFSFMVKKTPTYFYASLVLSLAESSELKYSKNTQGEENSWPEKFQLKHWKFHKYPENQGTIMGIARQLS